MSSILDIVKTLLAITDETQDSLLNLYIDIATNNVLEYCNIRTLPDGLKYTVAQMAVEAYKETTATDGTEYGGISSVSEAGRTVSFNSSLVQTLTENKINDRKTLLNRYKQAYRLWG